MRCEICGFESARAIESHHIIPRRFGGTDEDENLVDLCANCHRAIESIYDMQFWRRVAENQDDDKEWVTITND